LKLSILLLRKCPYLLVLRLSLLLGFTVSIEDQLFFLDDLIDFAEMGVEGRVHLLELGIHELLEGLLGFERLVNDVPFFGGDDLAEIVQDEYSLCDLFLRADNGRTEFFLSK
jgi:hypothetical protein